MAVLPALTAPVKWARAMPRQSQACLPLNFPAQGGHMTDTAAVRAGWKVWEGQQPDMHFQWTPLGGAGSWGLLRRKARPAPSLQLFHPLRAAGSGAQASLTSLSGPTPVAGAQLGPKDLVFPFPKKSRRKASLVSGGWGQQTVVGRVRSAL